LLANHVKNGQNKKNALPMVEVYELLDPNEFRSNGETETD